MTNHDEAGGQRPERPDAAPYRQEPTPVAGPPAGVPYPDRAGTARPSTEGPSAPVPPQPRVRWHIAAVLTGLVVTPLGLWLLGLGMTDLSPVSGSPPGLGGLLWILGGAAALSVVAAVSALGSSLGLIVGGTTWGVLLGLVGVLGWLTPAAGDAPAGSVAARTARAGELLLPTGFLLTVGVALVAAGVAAHHARRAGRRQERAEHELAAASAHGTSSPVPPASRLPAHLTSTALALLLMPLSLVMLSRAAGWLSAVEAGTASWGSDLPSLLALLAALLCVAAVLLTAAVSSLGPQLAGWLMALLPGLGVLLHEVTGWGWMEAPIDAVTRTPGSLLLVTTDFLLYLGVVTIVGGAAAHWARRHGRHLERSELTLAAR